MMERRYEAYKTHVIKPFFREHIARLDRQIVLVDALQALNAGPWAIADLERALAEILTCFRIGRGGFLTDLFSHRIDRILIAATKADHLHHESHDRLQAIVKRIADRAMQQADLTGAEVDVLAMAAVRATREGTVKQGARSFPSSSARRSPAKASATKFSTARPRPRFSRRSARRGRSGVRSG